MFVQIKASQDIFTQSSGREEYLNNIVVCAIKRKPFNKVIDDDVMARL